MGIDTLQPVVAYDAAFGATVLKQITNSSIDPGQEVDPVKIAGIPDPVAFFVQGEHGKFSIESSDLSGALALVSLTAGLDFTGAGSTHISFPLLKRQSGSTYQSGSVHDVVEFDRAVVGIESIEASHGQPASISLAGVAYNPDGWDPATGLSNYRVVSSQAVAASAFNASHTLGPVMIDGTECVGTTRTTVNVGLEWDIVHVDGLPQPRFCAIQSREPTIDIDFENGEAVKAFLKAAEASVVVCAFRHRKEGSTVDIDSVTSHITVSFGKSMTKLESLSASVGSNAQPRVRIHGSSLAVAVDTAL